MNLSRMVFKLFVRRPFLQALEPLVFVFAILLLPLLMIDMLSVDRGTAKIQDVARFWKDQPNVLRNVSSSDNIDARSFGFDALPLNSPAWPGAQSSCDCTHAPLRYWSTFAHRLSPAALYPIEPFSWRGRMFYCRDRFVVHFPGVNCCKEYISYGEGRYRNERAVYYLDNTGVFFNEHCGNVQQK